MITRTIWILALIALASGAIGCEGEPSPYGALQQATIYKPESWNDISTFEKNTDWRNAAIYGRAVALVATESISCSGWLIADDVVITADHCKPEAGQLVMALFGQFGSNDDGGWDAGKKVLLRRLHALGLPVPDLSDDDLDKLRRFPCKVLDSANTPEEGQRDLLALKCAPVRISYDLAGRSFEFPLLPGQLFGHLKSKSVDYMSMNAPIYGLSFNRPNAFEWERVVLSPNGKIVGPKSTCEATGEVNCFDTVGMDMICGSSGGAILDATDHSVIGVLVGTHGLGECDRTVREPDWVAEMWFSNVGVFLPTRFVDFGTPGVTTTAHNLPALVAQTPWAGRPGPDTGTTCPENTFAVGIFGTSAQTDGARRLGNFGLVCVPPLAIANYRLDVATVVASGSMDTHTTPKRGEHLTPYLAENLSESNATYGGGLVQTLALCPPGHYLAGLKALGNTSVDGIAALICRDLTTGQRLEHTLPERLGQSEGTTPAALECDAPGLVNGFAVLRGTSTQGLSLLCYGTGSVAATRGPQTPTPGTPQTTPNRTGDPTTPTPNRTSPGQPTPTTATPNTTLSDGNSHGGCQQSNSPQPIAAWPLLILLLSLVIWRRHNSAGPAQ